ncbi:SDR family oxidoreductase [Adhaeribacter sp. BT258]|uniref:SDR family oxidoreductase n=1 Tax=Adhaeribacter terrigena TaxID=2793070 RepID=A0ABS1BX40_9BACT|nr:oxidoreductase [Adhaeribacter terrigena]MBK0401711.1 SDR family oxidoreductase [Adhaeribacter terrigena]
MFSLKDKVIIVTGGSGLLGSLFRKTIEQAGGIAINADVNASKDLDQKEYYCNITEAGSIEELFEAIVHKYGRVDGLVNNAYPRTKDWGVKFEKIPAESWKQNVDMHLNGYFLCCQVATKFMEKQGFGAIVNIASIYGIVGPDFTIYDGTEMTTPAAYSAIKGAIVNFSRYLASYYGPNGIRVNCLSPGGIFDNQPESFVRNYSAKVPLRRLGKPEDIAPALVFLLTDEAAYITGHNLIVDGGWTAI